MLYDCITKDRAIPPPPTPPPPLPLLFHHFNDDHSINGTISLCWVNKSNKANKARKSPNFIANNYRDSSASTRVYVLFGRNFYSGGFFFFHSSYLINLKFDYFTHLVLEKVYRNLAWRKVWMQREMEIYIYNYIHYSLTRLIIIPSFILLEFLYI